jgi:hypothetical protein
MTGGRVDSCRLPTTSHVGEPEAVPVETVERDLLDLESGECLILVPRRNWLLRQGLPIRLSE